MPAILSFAAVASYYIFDDQSQFNTVAREEHAREDLLGEATALVQRIELIHRISGEYVVVGFRADGAPSFYFGEDPVFQFNAAGELRRVYRGGLMLKAHNGRLTALERRRTEQQVQLLSRELPPDESHRVIEDFILRAKTLAAELDAEQYEPRGQVPDHVDVRGRVRQLLIQLPSETLPIAHAPHAY